MQGLKRASSMSFKSEECLPLLEWGHLTGNLSVWKARVSKASSFWTCSQNGAGCKLDSSAAAFSVEEPWMVKGALLEEFSVKGAGRGVSIVIGVTGISGFTIDSQS